MVEKLYNLKLCVEKSLSKRDADLVKESFGVSIEPFSISFKKKLKPELKPDIPEVYQNIEYCPLPELEYDFNYDKKEKFSVSTTGTNGQSLNPTLGTDYGINPRHKTDYGINPRRETDYDGISQRKINRKNETNPEIISTPDLITMNSIGRMKTIKTYLLNKYNNPIITDTILNLKGIHKNSLHRQNTSQGLHEGVKRLIDNIAERINNGWNLTSYDLERKRGNYATITMKKGNNITTSTYNFGAKLIDSSSSNRNSTIIDNPSIIKAIDASLSIPIKYTPNQTFNSPVLYDLDRNLTEMQSLEYRKDFENVFKSISDFEEEEKQKQKLKSLEKYSEPIMLNRIKNFVDQGIIELSNHDLSLVQSIIQRKFFVKKVTISFGNENFVKKTPIIELESVRDNNGNIIEIDPIEYKIKDLTPINAVKTVLRERFFPLVNLEFVFLDEILKEGFELLESGVIRIGFNSKGGTWSMVGMDTFFSQDEFTMNFSWLDASTIMHEFCHFLGLIHEHQSPFGKPIQWDKPVIYEWAKVVYKWTEEETYQNIIKKYEKDELIGVDDYNPLSIMHYFFPAEFTLDKKGSPQNLRLHLDDLKFIQSVFPGKDIDYKIFYRQIYGKNIDEDFNWFYNLLKLLAFLVIMYTIYKIYKKIT